MPHRQSLVCTRTVRAPTGIEVRWRSTRRTVRLILVALLAGLLVAACGGATTHQDARQRLVGSLNSMMGQPGLEVQATMPIAGSRLVELAHALGLHMASIVPRLSGARLAVETTLRNHEPSDAPPPYSQYLATAATVSLHSTLLYQSVIAQGEEYLHVNWSALAALGGRRAVQALQQKRRAAVSDAGGVRRFLAGGWVSVPLTNVLSHTGSPNTQVNFLSQLATILKTNTVSFDPHDAHKYVLLAPTGTVAAGFLTAFGRLLPQAGPVLGRINVGSLVGTGDAHVDIFTSKTGNVEYLTLDASQFLPPSTAPRARALPPLFSIHLVPANPTISPPRTAVPVAYSGILPLLSKSSAKRRAAKGKRATAVKTSAPKS